MNFQNQVCPCWDPLKKNRQTGLGLFSKEHVSESKTFGICLFPSEEVDQDKTGKNSHVPDRVSGAATEVQI